MRDKGGRAVRRLGPALGGLVLAVGTLALAAPARAMGTDVAITYQGDTVHDGYQADVLAPPLTEAWSHSFGEQISYPVIADQMAFVTVGDNTLSTYGTTLDALSLSTGSVVWSVPLGGTYWWSGLAYDSGRLFALNYSGLLEAFDPLTGAQQWATQLPYQWAFTSAPTAADGYVYTAGAGSGGTLYAVSESTGAVAWTASVMNGDESSPVVTSSGVYVSYACQQTYDFNPTTGALIWHHATSCEGGGGKTAALSGNELYVRDPTLGDVILDASTGAVVGSFSAGPIPAFSGSTGYFLSGGTLSAQSTAKHGANWSFSGDGGLDTAPLVANGVVYEGSSSGNLYALSADRGALLWSGNTGSAILGPDEQNVSQPLTGMAVGEGMLLVPATDTLVAYQSSSTSSATAPSAPQALSATASVGAGVNQVALSWAPPAADGGSPVTGYEIYRGTSPGGETPLAAVGASATSYVDSAVSLGSTYYYEVTAINAVGPSPPSNEASATVATVPGAPTGLAATYSGGQVGLSWQAPSSDGGSSVEGYDVYEGTSPGQESTTPLNSSLVTGTSYSVGSLTNGTTYSFTVEAVNKVGNSAPSNEASATPQAPTVPTAPQGLVASGGVGQVSLSWSAPSSDGGSQLSAYDVFRGTSPGTESYLATVGPGTLSYSDTAVAVGTTYYYEVAAVNAAGTGPVSNEVAATPIGLPGAPLDLVASTGKSGGIDLSWQPPSSSGGGSIVEYQIYRSTRPGQETLYATVACQAAAGSGGTTGSGGQLGPPGPTTCPTTFVDSSTKKGRTYYYEVAAVNAAGTGPLSNEASAKAG